MKDCSLHLMDIAQNSTTAGASHIVITMEADKNAQMFTMSVTDDGCGMDDAFLQSVTDPFTTTRTTRKVGLGIPLLKLSAEMTGGFFRISSEKGKGTSLSAGFVIHSIDRIPVGDMPETLSSLISGWPEIDWTVHLKSTIDSFSISTAEITAVLDGVPIGNPAVAGWLNETFTEAMKTIYGGILDEITEGP